MPKLHKLRKRQKFRHDRNRRRIKKSQEKTRKDNIKVSSDVMKELWDPKESIRNNMIKMGVAFDANEVVGEKSMKAKLVEKLTKEEEEDQDQDKKVVKEKSEVIKRLEAEAAEAESNRKPSFRFPSEQVKWITYCLDKHGDDFKAMAKDPKNIWQETPKQIRQKLLKFITIPEQFNVYAKERGFLDE